MVLKTEAGYEFYGGRTRGVCRPYRMIQDPDLHEWDCEQALNVERLWERRADDA